MSIAQSALNCKAHNDNNLAKINFFVNTWRIPSEVVAAEGLSPGAKLLFARIWNLSSRGAQPCRRCLAFLAKDLKVTKPTVTKWHAELVTAKLVSRRDVISRSTGRSWVESTVLSGHPLLEGDSFYIPAHVVGNVRPASALVAGVLAYDCGAWGMTSTTWESISSRVGETRPRVRRSIEELVSAGVIAAWGGVKKGQGYHYAFFMTEDVRRNVRPGADEGLTTIEGKDFHGYDLPPWISGAGGASVTPEIAEDGFCAAAGDLQTSGQPLTECLRQSEDLQSIAHAGACAEKSILAFNVLIDPSPKGDSELAEEPEIRFPDKAPPPIALAPPDRRAAAPEFSGEPVHHVPVGTGLPSAPDGAGSRRLGGEVVTLADVELVCSEFRELVSGRLGVVVPEGLEDRWAARWLVSWYGVEGALSISRLAAEWWGGISSVLGIHRAPNLGVFCAKPWLAVQLPLWGRLVAAGQGLAKVAGAARRAALKGWLAARSKLFEAGGVIFDLELLEKIRKLDKESGFGRTRCSSWHGPDSVDKQKTKPYVDEMAKRSTGTTPKNTNNLGTAATTAAAKKSDEKRKKSRPEGHLHAVWTKLLGDRFGDDMTIVPWTIVEVKLVKALVKELGLEKAEKVMREFVKRWSGDSVPWIKALWTTRQRVIARVEGKVRDQIKDGEYDPSADHSKSMWDVMDEHEAKMKPRSKETFEEAMAKHEAKQEAARKAKAPKSKPSFNLEDY